MADALSRLPQHQVTKEETIQPLIGMCHTSVETTEKLQPTTLQELREATLHDLWLKENKSTCQYKQGLAWQEDKIYVPQVCRINILKLCHDDKRAGHFGFLKTLHLVKRQFWWPHMRAFIDKYVKGCKECAMSKYRIGKPIGPLQVVAEPTHPWQEIAMDFIVDLPQSQGHTVIWTVIDMFSKQAHFIPCKSLPSAKQLASLFIKHIYRLHGAPSRIISDRGVQFTAQFWRSFLAILGTSQGLSSAYHPCTNGAAERANALIERYLRSYTSLQQTKWIEFIPFAEYAYNNTVHSSTGYSPFFIVYGKEFKPLPDLTQDTPEHRLNPSVHEWSIAATGCWKDVKKALEQTSQRVKAQVDKKRMNTKPYQVGDKVLLSTKNIKIKFSHKKLEPRYIGPFTIKEVINPVTVKLDLPNWLGKIHPVFHINLLKEYIAQEEEAITLPTIPTQYVDIDKILDVRITRNQVKYLVKWKGYPQTEATWVKAQDIKADKLIQQFHEKQGML
uniref:Gypsy retrotransposon integrase-like protein 1 n=1 Tax=Micrurus lemniscatus lemniscatus TaxID=129467 RepID=A0A2D4IPV6_MICLE